MLLAVYKCQMCGERFEVELIDRDDPDERYMHGSSPRCKSCQSIRLELVDKRRCVKPR